MRFGAWIPALVLHALATWILFQIPDGGLKLAIPLIVYALLSWMLGLIFIIYLRKDMVAVLLAAFSFFVGPFFLYGYLHARDVDRHNDFLAAKAMVEQLCAKYGGVKIYRTVDDVEGVFQFRARNPSYKILRDREMPDPWSRAFGDGSGMGTILALGGKGYHFVEQQPSYGEPQGPPYSRTYIQYNEREMSKGKKDRDGRPILFYDRHDVRTEKLRSRYGWTTEDLTTEEMRNLWVGGGRFKVIELRTEEILAEYTGFYVALGSYGRRHWQKYPYENGCPYRPYLGRFLREVLKPVERIPSAQELESLKE